MKRIVVALALLGAALPPVPPDKAQVVFYRGGAFIGSALDCQIFDGPVRLGSLGRNNYFSRDIEIIPHRFIASGSPVIINPNAGETYYIECSMAMSLTGGHLHASTPDAFNAKVGKMQAVG